MSNKSDKRILFWIFIDGLHQHKDEIEIQFNDIKGKSYKLLSSTFHPDILYVPMPHENVFTDHHNHKFKYKYKINKHRTSDINREISFY